MCEKANGLIWGAVCELLNRVIALEDDLGRLDTKVSDKVAELEAAGEALSEEVEAQGAAGEALSEEVAELGAAGEALSFDITTLEYRVWALEHPSA